MACDEAWPAYCESSVETAGAVYRISRAQPGKALDQLQAMVSECWPNMWRNCAGGGRRDNAVIHPSVSMLGLNIPMTPVTKALTHTDLHELGSAKWALPNEQVDDVETALSSIPSVSVTAVCEVAGEPEAAISVEDIVTCKARILLSRPSHATQGEPCASHYCSFPSHGTHGINSNSRPPAVCAHPGAAAIEAATSINVECIVATSLLWRMTSPLAGRP